MASKTLKLQKSEIFFAFCNEKALFYILIKKKLRKTAKEICDRAHLKLNDQWCGENHIHVKIIFWCGFPTFLVRSSPNIVCQ